MDFLIIHFFFIAYCLLITVGVEKLTYKVQLTLLVILASANIFCAFII